MASLPTTLLEGIATEKNVQEQLKIDKPRLKSVAEREIEEGPRLTLVEIPRAKIDSQKMIVDNLSTTVDSHSDSNVAKKGKSGHHGSWKRRARVHKGQGKIEVVKPIQPSK